MRDYWSLSGERERKYFFGKPNEAVPALVKEMKRRGMRRVLDIGCGFGRNSIYFIENGLDTYGFDNSEIAVKTLRKRLKEKEMKMHLALHDSSKKFPYSDGFFDATVSISAIHHSTYKNLKGIAKEIERVTKNSGMLLITAPTYNSKYGKSEAKNFRRIGYRNYVPLDGVEKGVPHFYFDEKSVKRLFGGFDIKIRRVAKENKLDTGRIAMFLYITGTKIGSPPHSTQKS